MTKHIYATPSTGGKAMSEYEYNAEIDGLSVSVSKVGGGTIGSAYAGTWEYLATTAAGDIVILSGADLHTGMPKTHAEAAELVSDFAHQLMTLGEV